MTTDTFGIRVVKAEIVQSRSVCQIDAAYVLTRNGRSVATLEFHTDEAARRDAEADVHRPLIEALHQLLSEAEALHGLTLPATPPGSPSADRAS